MIQALQDLLSVQVEKIRQGLRSFILREELTPQELVYELLVPGMSAPKKGKPNSMGYDFYTPVPVFVPAKGSAKVDLQTKVQIPKGYHLMLWSRSGLAAKFSVEKGAGLIDYGYGQTLNLILYNHGDADQNFEMNERLVQGFLVKEVPTNAVPGVVNYADDDRGGGLGSSGLK